MIDLSCLMTSFFPKSRKGSIEIMMSRAQPEREEKEKGEGEGVRGVHAHHPIALPVRRVLRALGYRHGSFLY